MGAPMQWRMTQHMDPWFDAVSSVRRRTKPASVSAQMRASADYFMYLEPDVTTVRSSWLLELHKQTALDSSPFWAKVATWSKAFHLLLVVRLGTGIPTTNLGPMGSLGERISTAMASGLSKCYGAFPKWLYSPCRSTGAEFTDFVLRIVASGLDAGG